MTGFRAVYRHFGWGFRYVHVIEELLTGPRQKGLFDPTELDDSTCLTDYAFETRYVGLGEPVSREPAATIDCGVRASHG
jgi:hypothetical protein